MSIWNGIGTTYLGFSRRLPDGGHHATQWFVVMYMPIVPLRRYRLLVGRTTYGTSVSTTEYRVLERGALRPAEVLVTYGVWWIFGPAVLALPWLLMAGLIHLGVIDNTTGTASSWLTVAMVLVGLAWMVAAPMTISTRARRIRGLS